MLPHLTVDSVLTLAKFVIILDEREHFIKQLNVKYIATHLELFSIACETCLTTVMVGLVRFD